MLSENMARRLRRQATGWEKISAKHLSDRGLVSVSKIYQTFKQTTKPLKTQQETIQLQNGQN